MKMLFKCKKCGKEILVERNIYNKIYLNQDLCLSCKNRILNSVSASVKIEGLKPREETISLGKDVLNGKITIEEAISKIKGVD